ncbi:unnamed protein product [Sphagnum troendelagicum]
MAQAVLTALDTLMTRKWREQERTWRKEKRQWREEDMVFREEECAFHNRERELRNLSLRWREEDMKQRRVNNSRYVWARCAELNRRDVDEKAEHLRLLSWLTGLITSFTMTSPIEFNVDPHVIAIPRLAAYAVCTALVPALMTAATMMCVFLLSSILKMGKLFVSEEAEEEFMLQCRTYSQTTYAVAQAPPAPRRTFERFWESRCEDEWNRAFQLFSMGIMWFLVLLCTMSFIKFQDEDFIAISFSIIMGISFILWQGLKYRWGRYLRKEAHSAPVVLSHRTQNFLCSDDPFKWHLQPIRGASAASFVAVSDQEPSSPSLSGPGRFNNRAQSCNSFEMRPLEDSAVEHEPSNLVRVSDNLCTASNMCVDL